MLLYYISCLFHSSRRYGRGEQERNKEGSKRFALVLWVCVCVCICLFISFPLLCFISLSPVLSLSLSLSLSLWAVIAPLTKCSLRWHPALAYTPTGLLLVKSGPPSPPLTDMSEHASQAPEFIITNKLTIITQVQPTADWTRHDVSQEMCVCMYVCVCMCVWVCVWVWCKVWKCLRACLTDRVHTQVCACVYVGVFDGMRPSVCFI